MPRYIGTLNVTHRDYVSSETPPSPLSLTPNSQSPLLSPANNTPTRTITPLPEVQIDKNRHVPSLPLINAYSRLFQNGYYLIENHQIPLPRKLNHENHLQE
jgi:hypothetical protein